MEGGFRLYSEEDVRRVEQIRRLQSLLGFSLAEIKEMVEAEEELEHLREEARNSGSDADGGRLRLQRAIEITERQYAVIGQKVLQLTEMERLMEAKLEKYRARLAKLEETAPPAEVGRPS
jgi:DNA-binding transcriptional MerR regulator